MPVGCTVTGGRCHRDSTTEVRSRPCRPAVAGLTELAFTTVRAGGDDETVLGRNQAETSRPAPVSMRICSAPATLSVRTDWAMAARAASGVAWGGTTSSEK